MALSAAVFCIFPFRKPAVHVCCYRHPCHIIQVIKTKHHSQIALWDFPDKIIYCIQCVLQFIFQYVKLCYPLLDHTLHLINFRKRVAGYLDRTDSAILSGSLHGIRYNTLVLDLDQPVPVPVYAVM